MAVMLFLGTEKDTPFEQRLVEIYESVFDICKRYASEAQAVDLGHEEAALIAGGSDASSTAAIGIPSIDGLGPRGSGFHTKEELIEIESLEPKALALARFVWKYGGC